MITTNDITKHITESYLKAVYRVTTADNTINIKINTYHDEIDNLLKLFGGSSWVLITAYNPKSRILPKQENETRNRQLFTDINDYQIFSAENSDEKGDWIEHSFLVLGIDRMSAINLAKKYEQNAVLFGLINEKAELIWVQD